MDTEPKRADGFDSVSVGLMSEGLTFAISILGPQHMSVTHMTDALRAALFYLLKAGQADPELMKGIGARVAVAGEFDTVGKTN